MSYYYYNTRLTKANGEITTIIQVRKHATAFGLVGTYPSGSTIEAKLLGFGPPTIRAGRRLFHTQAQANSYTRGYSNRSTSSETPALDDFSDMGINDRDSDEEYRQEARECSGHSYDSNDYQGND